MLFEAMLEKRYEEYVQEMRRSFVNIGRGGSLVDGDLIGHHVVVAFGAAKIHFNYRQV
jgi:hypothetical protein